MSECLFVCESFFLSEIGLKNMSFMSGAIWRACSTLCALHNASLKIPYIKNILKKNPQIDEGAVVFTYILLSVCILPVVRHDHPPHQSLKIQEPRLGQTHWQ